MQLKPTDKSRIEMTTVSVRLPVDKAERLTQAAEAAGITVSEALRQLIDSLEG